MKVAPLLLMTLGIIMDSSIASPTQEMNALYYKSKSTARQNDEKQTCNLVSKLLKFDTSHDHEHDHEHDHMKFIEKIQKDSDFKKMRKNANFLFLLKNN